MRREVMKRAWELKRKGFGTLSECLKKSWELSKKIVSKNISKEKALDIVNSSDRRTLQDFGKKSLATFREYLGEARVTFTNPKLWLKNNIVRIYVDKYLDGIYVGQTFVA